MKSLNLVLVVLFLWSSSSYSQTVNSQPDDDEKALRKVALLSDLKTLAIEIPKISGSLARALADAEIADAAWLLDRGWAKTLLKEAYQLTYPSDEELAKSPPRPVGAEPKQKVTDLQKVEGVFGKSETCRASERQSREQDNRRVPGNRFAVFLLGSELDQTFL